MANQTDPDIAKRRGLKDGWPMSENPQVKGAPTSVKPKARGHDAEPRGRRKFVS